MGEGRPDRLDSPSTDPLQGSPDFGRYLAAGPLPVKSSKRLDYAIFSEVLGQRGLVERERLSLALQTAQQGIIPLPEMLVGDNLIGDWQLSSVVCDLYGLPFLPTDFYQPSEDAAEGLDRNFLRQQRLVPMTRYGRVLVVAMPGLVSAEVLEQMEKMHDVKVFPVVGTVHSNNRWLQDNMPLDAEATESEGEGDWGSLFDVGDAAVLMDLDPEEERAQAEALAAVGLSEGVDVDHDAPLPGGDALDKEDLTLDLDLGDLAGSGFSEGELTMDLGVIPIRDDEDDGSQHSPAA